MLNEKNMPGIALLRAVLAEEFRKSSDARYLHRLHCVLLMLQGHGSAKVAEWFEHDGSTVTRWMRIFQRCGVTGLQENRRSGRRAGLDVGQRHELQRALARAPCESGLVNHRHWSGKLVANFLEKRYGMSFSVRQSQRLLHELRDDAAAVTSNRPKERLQPSQDASRQVRRTAS